MPRSRRRSNARRRLASEGFLPSVIMGSATRRSSLAFGRVVLISSCRRSETVMFRSIDRRCAEVRLSFLSPFPWRMFLGPVFQTGRWPVLEFHAQGEAARGEHFLDLVQRFAAEVRRLEELGL